MVLVFNRDEKILLFSDFINKNQSSQDIVSRKLKRKPPGRPSGPREKCPWREYKL